jgi:hypothetical protein
MRVQLATQSGQSVQYGSATADGKLDRVVREQGSRRSGTHREPASALRGIESHSAKRYCQPQCPTLARPGVGDRGALRQRRVGDTAKKLRRRDVEGGQSRDQVHGESYESGVWPAGAAALMNLA